MPLRRSYPNTGYIGFPLGMIAFGPASQTPTTIATILVACVLFAIAIVLIEVGLQTERAPHKLALKVLGSLARNPLIVSPIAACWSRALHVTLPQSAETFLKLLGGAASPCALVSLGLFLAEKRAVRAEAGKPGASLLLTGIKLLAATGADLVARGARLCAVATARRNGRRAGRAAHRHRPVHARGVLSARSAHHLADHSAFYGRLARDALVAVAGDGPSHMTF